MTDLICKIFIKDYNNPSDSTVRKKYGTVASIVGISVNLLLSVFKLVVGILSASIAITADGLNNFSDAGASIISLVSFKLAAKPADKDHPFGHARIEYIASMIVSFMILLVGFELLTDSFSGIINPGDITPTQFSIASLIVLGSSILVKLWLSVFFRKVGKKINSGVIKASATDSLTDCISTATVLVSTIVIKFTGLEIIDACVGLGVAILIIIAGIKILNETKNSILGEAPMKDTIDQIKGIISTEPEVIGVHHMMIHNYGPNKFIASFHAEVDGAHDIYMLHDKIDNLERQIEQELNIACTIHLDPIVTNDLVLQELKAFAMQAIHKIDSRIGMHDFRAVIGNTHTNLIFDIEVPFDINLPKDALVELISKKISDERPECFCVITVDRI